MMITTIFITCCSLIFLFFFLKVVSGTPSEDAFWGAVALIALYQAISLIPIEWPQLKVIEPWLIPGLVIALMVLFTSELKRLLSLCGTQVNWRRFISVSPISHRVIDEVVEATDHLSRNSTGALIVIRQRADLSVFVRGGVELDARVHSGLVYALFISARDNHLHDGAVVIEGDRLTRAASYLPMTRSLNLEQHLGTRHRAALGISEETDAVVIVVSEERGSISVAYGGRLEEAISTDQLSKRLYSLVTAKQ
jgi:diadenylate cyclase